MGRRGTENLLHNFPPPPPPDEIIFFMMPNSVFYYHIGQNLIHESVILIHESSQFSDCDITLTDHAGVIESPNFPRPYPRNRDCVWIIDVGQGNKVNASFSHFDLDEGTNCRQDKLEVNFSTKINLQD